MTFQLEIEGFSGPLDLLCHMVESREIEAVHVRVSQVIALYGTWLASQGGLPIAELAEFIAQAARLVLHKTRALLPRPEPEADEDFSLDENTSPDLESFLRGYRPYRKAAEALSSRFLIASRRHFREGGPLPLSFDLGDLYSLSILWLGLVERRRSARESLRLDEWDEEAEGVPTAIPDEEHVERRMESVLEKLSLLGPRTLRWFLANEPGRGPLVVTLLALLELSRRNTISLQQEEVFGDVRISLRAV